MKVGTQLFHESIGKMCKKEAERDKVSDSYMKEGKVILNINRK